MTTEQVPLAAQIEKVRREIHYAREDHAEMAERLWSAVLATLQQHERAMAALRAVLAAWDKQDIDAYEICGRDEMQKLFDECRAALDDAASAAATPAGKGETPQFPCQRCGAYRPGCSDPLCPTPLPALPTAQRQGRQMPRIPHDLTKAEAEKIARVVMATASCRRGPWRSRDVAAQGADA